MVYVSCVLVAIQLLDAYIRALAYIKEISREQKFILLKNLLSWGALSFGLYYWIFYRNGLGALEYKLMLLFGETPYILIFIYIVGGNLWRHFFNCNMIAIWAFVIHNIAAMTTVTFFLDGKSDAEIIQTHLTIYLMLAIIVLPVAKYFFTRLLPPEEFFLTRAQGMYIATLPLIILMAHFIRLTDNILVHSWEERFSRIYLPFVFIFFYKYALAATKNFYRQRRLERLEKGLSAKLAELKDYNKFLQEVQKKVSVMRHDLRHSYRLVYALLKNGDILKAREHLITQSLLLEAAIVRPFCKSSLVSNALSIYFERAEELNIEIFHRIHIPDEFKTDENDFGVLLSNLLDNAINLSILLETETRRISVIILHESGRFILEITCRCELPLNFGADGLPKNLGNEHYAGITSLKNFLNKYDAYFDLNQSDGQVKLSMYWRD